jgi:sigma-B regulation protein RsbU (phosphoserine phosphatase)
MSSADSFVPYLVQREGPEPGRQFPLGEASQIIGRNPECDILVPDRVEVSRHHAEVARREGRYYVRDLDSHNGTLLNGFPIDSTWHLLRHGDALTLSTVSFVFQGMPDVRPESESTLEPVLVEDPPTGETAEGVVVKVDSSLSDSTASSIVTLQARLAALLRITRDLGRVVALDEVLPQVIESLFAIFPQVDRAFIVMQDERGELVPRWAQARNPTAERTVPISRTIVRQVMRSREAILSNNVAQDERIDLSQSIAGLPIRSMMCAPLLDASGSAIGVLQVDTSDPWKVFQTQDLEVLAGVALQAGLAINRARLREYALAKKNLDRDLELAHEVQEAFLPRTTPEISGYEFFSYYTPANHVGGDYYDYVRLPDGRTAVLVADVVGKGVAAAMMMAKVAAEAKYCLGSLNDPASAISELNDRISGIHVDRFVTMILIVLDPQQHEATIVRAGHMPPIWRHVDGSTTEPGAELSGLPVGILSGATYGQQTIALTPGEMLAVYTDGISEAMNPSRAQYSTQRIHTTFAKATGSVRQVGRAIISDTLRHVGSGTQSDDMCLVILHRTET